MCEFIPEQWVVHWDVRAVLDWKKKQTKKMLLTHLYYESASPPSPVAALLGAPTQEFSPSQFNDTAYRHRCSV